MEENWLPEMQPLPGALENRRFNEELKSVSKGLKVQKQLKGYLLRVSGAATQAGHCCDGASGAAHHFHHSHQMRQCGGHSRGLKIPRPNWLVEEARRYHSQSPAHSWKAEEAEGQTALCPARSWRAAGAVGQTARYPTRSCRQAGPQTCRAPSHRNLGEHSDAQPPRCQSWCLQSGL